MAEPILVLGAGPAAALATLRLAQSRRAVRAVPGPPNPAEETGIERLGRLPNPDPLLDSVACHRIRIVRHCLAGTGPAVSFEFRESPGGTTHRLLRRRDVSRALWRAAQALGAQIDDTRAPVGVRPGLRASPEVQVGSELLRPPLVVVSDPELLPRAAPAPALRERLWQAEFPVPVDRIEARFGLDSGEGVHLDAVLPVPAVDMAVGGFLRTGPEGIAAGIILRSRSRPPTEEEARAAGVRWIEHPLIAPLLTGTKAAGESLLALPPGVSVPPWTRGCLPIGRAAGLLATNGLEYRGLGAELASAELATSVVPGEPTRTAPGPPDRAAWSAAWRASQAIQDLRRWARRADRFKWGPGLSDTLPKFMVESVHELMTETGAPKRRVGATVRAVAQTGGYPRVRLLRSAIAWMEAM